MPYSDPAKRRNRTPEQKARQAERERIRYASDPSLRERSRLNYHRNGWRWKSQSQPYLAAKDSNKQARKLGVPGVITVEDIEALWRLQPECVNCGRGCGLDHIVAMVRGGANVPANLQNLCLPCNQVKHKWDLPVGQIPRPPFDGDEIRCRRGHVRVGNEYHFSGRRTCKPCHQLAVRRYRDRLHARKTVAA